MSLADDSAAQARLGLYAEEWHLESLVGVGGMAAVYRASRSADGQRAAVKILHPRFAAHAEMRQRFLRESVVANRVTHPGVVRLLPNGVRRGEPSFLVMELLHGSSVETLRQAGTLALDDVIEIIDGLLDVLAAVHQDGIVHRDIKPANVFVTKAKRIKLLDFGIARIPLVEEDTAPATAEFRPFGTPGFMAPEQARGAIGDIDACTDVWGAGALMFLLLAGRFVHDDSDPGERARLARDTPVDALRKHAPAVPQEIAEVVDRALSFGKEQRFSDAGKMRTALAEAVQRQRNRQLLADADTSPPLMTAEEAALEWADADAPLGRLSWKLVEIALRAGEDEGNRILEALTGATPAASLFQAVPQSLRKEAEGALDEAAAQMSSEALGEALGAAAKNVDMALNWVFIPRGGIDNTDRRPTGQYVRRPVRSR